ncbi:hypothetical protein DCCM_4659 [Desulfocucumis palustris]|uniref:Glucokinase n=1 Tax=Desulfocucumis palustris TaxID=1898651 RepID=A0A2L2XHA9_9FIRM|nr:hypothetical protein DCCM_4659 [Desulfocucumis palustris]
MLSSGLLPVDPNPVDGVEPLNKCLAAVDLGGTKIYTALADSRGKLLAETRVPTNPGEGMEAVIRRIAGTVEEVYNSGGAGRDICCLGMGVPGPVDPETGVLYQAPNLGWRDVHLKKILQKRFAVPVLVDNDANLAALGEHTFGAGAGERNMVYVTVSTGIGGGLILDGKIYHGASGGAGEVGHMVVEPMGPLCGCGKRGCLEALASGTAMAARAREMAGAGAGRAILAEAGGRIEDIDAGAVAAAAGRGDEEALEILWGAGRALGMGLANVVNLLNPGLVVLGGGAMNAGKPLWETMEEELRSRAMPGALERVKVVPAALGKRSGLLGAVALAMGGRPPGDFPQ